MAQRGELTSEQIIAIVLAIIGFVILIAFLTQFGTEDYSADELCRLSVLSRAQAASAVEGVQTAIPLQCTTKKVCITTTKDGKCNQFVGEKDVVNVQLPSSSDKTGAEQATQISRVLAENMYSCWNMMGEGKLDLFNSVSKSFGFSQAQSKCVICSRIALGDDIPGDVIKQINLDTYLEKYTVPGQNYNYISAFTNGATGSYARVDQTSKDPIKDKSGQTINLGGVNTNELALVFMQIKSSGTFDALKKQLELAGIAGAGAFVAKPSALLSGGRLVVSTGGILTILGVAALDTGFVTYNSLKSQDTAVGYCGAFTSKDNAANGCSLLEAIPYSVKDVGQLCSDLEGNV